MKFFVGKKNILENFLKIEYVFHAIPEAENGANLEIVAPVVKDYKFLCWVNVSTHGTTANCYIDAIDSPTANIWFTQSTMYLGSAQVFAYALYVKD